MNSHHNWAELLALDLEAQKAAIMADLKRDFEVGDNTALLDAVSHCLNAGTQPPNWVTTGFNACWEGWRSGAGRTLDDAFNIHRPKNWRKQRARKDYITTLIWQSTVLYMRENPGTISQALFSSVADEWNQRVESETKDSFLHGLKINSTDVQDAYYAISKISKIPVNEPN